MKADLDLKDDVIDELVWNSSVNETNIGVAVKKGIVTLSGTVDNYSEKIAVEKAAKKVAGVRAVVMDIEVKVVGDNKRTDVEIAEVALNSLKWNTTVPKEAIVVKVEDGWVTLDGSVNWNYQKEAAKRAVQNLFGVRGVSNLIQVKSTVQPTTVKSEITKSFKRNAELDAEDVHVEVDGHKIILTGSVRTWNELREAEDAAWSAPGVWQVENKLLVETPELI